MLVRQKGTNLAVPQEFGHEPLENITLLEPFPVLREARRAPHGIVGSKAHEPAVQKVVIELLHELPLGTDAVERLQKQRAQQLFGRDRGSPLVGIQRAEIPVQRRQNLPHDLAHLAQRMARRNPFLR